MFDRGKEIRLVWSADLLSSVSSSAEMLPQMNYLFNSEVDN